MRGPSPSCNLLFPNSSSKSFSSIAATAFFAIFLLGKFFRSGTASTACARLRSCDTAASVTPNVSAVSFRVQPLPPPLPLFAFPCISTFISCSLLTATTFSLQCRSVLFVFSSSSISSALISSFPVLSSMIALIVGRFRCRHALSLLSPATNVRSGLMVMGFIKPRRLIESASSSISPKSLRILSCGTTMSVVTTS